MKKVEIQIEHNVNGMDNVADKITRPTTINRAMPGYRIGQAKREKKEVREVEIANILLKGRTVRMQQNKDLKRITVLI